MHLMTIEMGAWCGASGPGNGRASSQWREVTCPECAAKGAAWLRALVWDMLQVLPASPSALQFALRAGRLGVTDATGRALAAACGARPYPAGSEGDDGTECALPAGHYVPHDDLPEIEGTE
jgi:hypothetical protein